MKAFIEEKISSPKTAIEMNNCITWMEENWEIVQQNTDISYYHPSLVYSWAIRSIISKWKVGNELNNQLIINWLCSNVKYPFGMIDKIRAFRAITQNFELLSKAQIIQLTKLQSISNEMKYRPREILYLDKLLNKIAQQGDAPEPASPAR